MINNGACYCSCETYYRCNNSFTHESKPQNFDKNMPNCKHCILYPQVEEQNKIERERLSPLTN